MIGVDRALEIIKSQETELKTERVRIENALGRLLVTEIESPIDSPPFAKAAMDGYAVDSSDTSGSFEVIEVVAAGEVPTGVVTRGKCVRIMTGAMMPEGADKVIPVEYTKEEDGIMYPIREETRYNVIGKAENLKKGSKVLSPRVLNPKEIGIIASMGIDSVEVAKKPVVGVIITGSELKDPGERLKPGQIYNSNGVQLCAQIGALACKPRYYGIVEDNRDTLNKMISRASAECDIVLFSGGVSKGDYDFVPGILEESGFDILFHRVAMKPGRPTLFGRRGNLFVFGLPGNPVTSFVIFEVMVKALIFRMAGLKYEPFLIRGRLKRDIRRKKIDRTDFRPVKIDREDIYPVEYHGSSHINVMAESNALLMIREGIRELKEGDYVDVRPI